MRIESSLGSGVVGRDFDGDFGRGTFDGLPTKESVATGADLACTGIFLVGEGTSSSDVSWSTLRLRFLVGEGPSYVLLGG